jgi:putative transposase
MARFARVVAVGLPHHITQRGNARRFILDSDAGCSVYLQLLHRYTTLHELSLLGYCLMSSHVHLIAVPHRSDSLHLALKHTHGRYAAYRNVRHASSGHVWLGRYYSCPLDMPHLSAALRYTELNPVRAGLASAPESYLWSSEAAHCGRSDPHPLLDTALWRQTWTPAAWRDYLAGDAAVTDADATAIRSNTHTGRPLGTPQFTARLEEQLQRRLTPAKGGRPRKRAPRRQTNELRVPSLVTSCKRRLTFRHRLFRVVGPLSAGGMACPVVDCITPAKGYLRLACADQAWERRQQMG